MRQTLAALFGLVLATAALAAPAPQQKTPAPGPTPSPSPVASEESPGQALIEQEESALSGRTYSYDPAGRRDPFRSLLMRPRRG
jgi:hypothetical protein